MTGAKSPYYRGLKCAAGHSGLRYRSTRHCVFCQRQRAATLREREREEMRQEAEIFGLRN